MKTQHSPRINEQLTEPQRYIELLGGTVVAMTALQVFVVPLGLYNGGIMGCAQIIRTLIEGRFGTLPFDIAGILNLLLNVPLLIIGYRYLSKDFFFHTIFVVAASAVTMSVIRINEPIISDKLTGCLIGGVLAGVGTGIILRAGGSGAGFDIIGIILSKYRLRFGVGLITTSMNIVVYILCFVLFSPETALYSIVFAVFYAVSLDRIHTQNVTCQAIILSRKKGLQDIIQRDILRTSTCWEAQNSRDPEEWNVYLAVLSRYEVETLKKIILEQDPAAIISITTDTSVYGGFERRL